MSNIVFYKDSIDTFECDIKVDGATTSNTKARLVLEFQNKSLLFNGSIHNGRVSVKIPKLSEIDEHTGNATLEIIADQTFFEAWKSNFELKNKKNVTVNEIKINSGQPKIVVENVSKNQKTIITPKIKPKNNLIRESCSDNNRQFVMRSFDRFKNLNKKEKNKVLKELKSFTPKNITVSWANNVFENPSSQYAKYCMMELQMKNRR